MCFCSIVIENKVKDLHIRRLGRKQHSKEPQHGNVLTGKINMQISIIVITRLLISIGYFGLVLISLILLKQIDLRIIQFQRVAT